MPIVHTVLALIASSVDVDDSERMMEVNLLRRSYFLFLSTVVSNGCVGVFCDLGKPDGVIIGLCIYIVYIVFY